MSSDLAGMFTDRLAAAAEQLARVPLRHAELPYRNGGWLRKEILGHLIDSAINNHVRFGHGAVAGRFEGPTYDQENWVKLHGYAAMPWPDFARPWRKHNELLARLVEHIPTDALAAECRVGNGDVVTLGFLIEDYLDHLEHHVAQITEQRADATR